MTQLSDYGFSWFCISVCVCVCQCVYVCVVMYVFWCCSPTCSKRVMANFWCGMQCLAVQMSSLLSALMWKWIRIRRFS